MLSSDGEEIGAFSIENRRIVPLERMPPHVPAAFLVRRGPPVLRAPGFDLVGIVRAACDELPLDGEIKQGGSTITQQIIKQTLLAGEEGDRLRPRPDAERARAARRRRRSTGAR